MFFRMLVVPTLALLLTSCGDKAHQHTTSTAAVADPHAGHDHGPAAAAIQVTDMVQKNLGITWATAEYRVVQGVVRMPGRFAAESGARRPYQTPAAGRIEVLVAPYDTVAAGQALYRIEAAEWQRLQQELAAAHAAVDLAEDQLTAAQAHSAALAEALRLWTDRLATLDRLGQDIGGKAAERVEAAARIADLRISGAESTRALAEATRQARGPDGTARSGQARLQLDLLFMQAAQLTGQTPAELATVRDGRPAWAGITAITIHATGPGVVEGEVLASGTWLDGQQTVLTVTDPRRVHLRASGLQADLPRMRDGLPARIVATDPAVAGSLPATLVLGPVADAIDRSQEVIAHIAPGSEVPAWIRPGVTANLEVMLSGSAEEELAIPVAATIRDGLDTIFFKRHPKEREVVTREKGDLGVSDGRWVVVNSGLKEGDQVVLGGIYPLKLSQQQGGAQAGHFEADGTFHTGKH